jgi:hypothetical protein
MLVKTIPDKVLRSFALESKVFAMRLMIHGLSEVYPDCWIFNHAHFSPKMYCICIFSEWWVIIRK